MRRTCRSAGKRKVSLQQLSALGPFASAKAMTRASTQTCPRHFSTGFPQTTWSGVPAPLDTAMVKVSETPPPNTPRRDLRETTERQQPS